MSVIIHNTCITERQLEGSHDPDPVIEFDLLRLQAVTIPHGGWRDKPFLKGECKLEVFKVALYNGNRLRSARDSLCSEDLENSGVEADNDVWHGQASVGLVGGRTCRNILKARRMVA